MVETRYFSEKEIKYYEGVANTYVILGNVFYYKGIISKAYDCWEKAIVIYKRIGIAHMIKLVQGLLDKLENPDAP